MNEFFIEQDPHSLIKSIIVEKYFNAWANVMKKHKRFCYIDLFSGKGKFDDGSNSTPLLVINKVIADSNFRNCFDSFFNDVDQTYVEELKQNIFEINGINTLKHKPIIENNEVSRELIIDLISKYKCPKLSFLDPWGYKGLTLEAITLLTESYGSECILFFNYNRINMAITNPIVSEHIDSIFGKENADFLRKEIHNMDVQERESTIIKTFQKSIKEKLDSDFILPFSFEHKDKDKTSHYLFFISKNKTGYKIMKEVMAKFSHKITQGVASFKFKPDSRNIPQLFETSKPLDELMNDLVTKFKGQTLTTKEIFEMHNIGTWYIPRNYKDALILLEKDGKIEVDKPLEKRPKNTMGDKRIITFK